MSEAQGLDAVSAELYGGAPADFVARRDELVKAARADGDRELATAIKALRRPTVGAWYLNLAAAAGLTSLRELLELGRELRETQAAGDFAALRDLAGRRGPLVGRVLRDLTAHLAQVGITTTGSGLDEVRTTLGAALADPAVDAQVRSGRVDRAHSYGGFGEVEMAVVPPAPSPSPSKEAPKKDADAAKEQLAAARRELAAAERERATTEARGKEAGATVRAARKRVESLETELDRARDALSKAEAEAAGLKARAAALTATIEQSRTALASG
ncbi:MAG TPA: hypothetical protein VGK18_13280 [Propionicimonas sp.]|uniref:hypothetical protein n=1 Tax=Propionicimonas sp. TaxID=1955623 RepID=UPI002F419D57